MDAKEAQDQTERRWLAEIANPNDVPPACGWCLFAKAMTTENRHRCHTCPVVRVFGDSCCNIEEYIDWDLDDTAEAAREVYELLIAHRDQLIAAAKEIENEQTIRD